MKREDLEELGLMHLLMLDLPHSVIDFIRKQIRDSGGDFWYDEVREAVIDRIMAMSDLEKEMLE